MSEETEAIEAVTCTSCHEPLDELSLALETKECHGCRTRARDGEELQPLTTAEV